MREKKVRIGRLAAGAAALLMFLSCPAAAETVQPVQGELNIERIEDLPEDFIMGVDISSVMAEFAGGVAYRDFDGSTINNIDDFCLFLAGNGITHVRVRVWNDPFDKEGNGYGGGNNDTATAAAIAEGCRNAGLKLLVDFHCSDFWADPSKQQAPKAWEGLSLEEKKEALYRFVAEALEEIDPQHDTVDMVQIGNEITGGIAGETDTESISVLLNAGVKAVREYGEEVKAVIHITNPEKGNITGWAGKLDKYGVDYDILASSYYPYWHGTLENLKNELAAVRETYGRDVMIAETSYAYTLLDTDGQGNTVQAGSNDKGSNITEPFTVQGQAAMLRSLMEAVNEAGGLGVFYWEPAWITVGDTTGLEGDELAERIDANKEIWESSGSGWAASYAAEYDPEDAGKWYGGSAVDNQAMFYPDGTATPAWYVWSYVRTGAVTDRIYEEETLPGETTEETTERGPNLITDPEDAGFEKGENFTIGGRGVSPIPAPDDPYAGSSSMHWYDTEGSVGTVIYDKEITLGPGSYCFEAMSQGCQGDEVTLQILDTGEQVLFEGEPAVLANWINWKTPSVHFVLEEETTVKLGIRVKFQNGGWGTVDELYLYETE